MGLETYESIQEKINTLRTAIDTENDKIKRLSKYTNYLQLRMWREHRRRMNFRLAYFLERQKLYTPNETLSHKRQEKGTSR